MSTPDYQRKRHDDAPPFLYAPAYADGSATNFTGAVLRFIMTPVGSSTPKVDAAGVITPSNAFPFSYAPIPADVDTAGRYFVEWEVTYSNGKVETWPTTTTLVCLIRPDLA